MPNVIRLAGWFCLILGGVAACSQPATATLSSIPDGTMANAEALFSRLVGIESFNLLVGLEQHSALPTSAAGYHLRIFNKTGNSLTFPPDFGLRVFAYSAQDGQWVELEDNTQSLNTAPIILDPKGGFLPDNYTVTSPKLPPNHDSSLIRVLVVGQVIEEGTPTPTVAAAYLDIPLAP